MSNNMCELCGNKEAKYVRFGVKICPECLKDNTSRSARDNSTKNQSNSDSTSSSTIDEILYSDIGKKIKGWAKWTFIIEAVCSVFGAILSVFAMESIDEFYIPLLWIVLGPIVAWVSSWLLYAFGELVDKTTMNEKHLRSIYQLMSKDT